MSPVSPCNAPGGALVKSVPFVSAFERTEILLCSGMKYSLAFIGK